MWVAQTPLGLSCFLEFFVLVLWCGDILVTGVGEGCLGCGLGTGYECGGLGFSCCPVQSE